MRLKEARVICPDIIQRPARPEIYVGVSTAIMRALVDITPDIEVFSVDEAFLDVTRCQKVYGTPPRMGILAKEKIFAVSRLKCSVGISGDKSTAKYASDLQKPDGLTIIPPWESEQRLAKVPVTQLCGIADGIGNFLAQHGVFVCGDMKQLPVSVLERRFGALGIRLWLMCQGRDPSQVQVDVPPPKSVGHGKVLPPGTRDRSILLTYLLHMSEKVAARLRKYGLEARHYFVGLRTKQGWIAEKRRLIKPGNDGRDIYNLCQFAFDCLWHGEEITHVQVTALDPRSTGGQTDMFLTNDTRRDRLNDVTDRVNRKYGEFKLAPATLLNRSSMPNVIAPAWKPSGHRQTIQGVKL